MAQPRTLAGFAAEATDAGFAIHIIDDSGDVFEISASRENVELIVDNLKAVLAGGSGEDAHAKG